MSANFSTPIIPRPGVNVNGGIGGWVAGCLGAWLALCVALGDPGADFPKTERLPKMTISQNTQPLLNSPRQWAILQTEVTIQPWQGGTTDYAENIYRDFTDWAKNTKKHNTHPRFLATSWRPWRPLGDLGVLKIRDAPRYPRSIFPWPNSYKIPKTLTPPRPPLRASSRR